MSSNYSESELAAEVWKDVVGYEGRYSVSNSGQTHRAIAKDLGVNAALISLVRQRKVWKHVELPHF